MFLQIFSLSPDLFSIVFFGFSKPSDGFYVARDFKPPEFDALDVLNEVKPGLDNNVDGNVLFNPYLFL